MRQSRASSTATSIQWVLGKLAHLHQPGMPSWQVKGIYLNGPYKTNQALQRFMLGKHLSLLVATCQEPYRRVVVESGLRNDTRQVRLAFTFGFGQAGFKSKRVETNTNATERGPIGNVATPPPHPTPSA